MFVGFTLLSWEFTLDIFVGFTLLSWEFTLDIFVGFTLLSWEFTIKQTKHQFVVMVSLAEHYSARNSIIAYSL
jgi:hypothetical protein